MPETNLNEVSFEILNKLNVPVTILDEDYKIVLINKAQEAIFQKFGKMAVEEAIGQDFFQLSPMHNHFKKMVDEALNSGLSIYKEEMKMPSPKMKDSKWDLAVIPTTNNGKKYVAVVLQNIKMKIINPEDGLTDKEKRCLYALVRYPDLNDSQLAKSLGLPISTVTTNRNKLVSKEYLRTIRIPNFEALGYEFVEIAYGKFQKHADFKERSALEGFKNIVESPNLCMIRTTDTEFMGMSLIKNFTQYEKLSKMFLSIYRKDKILNDSESVKFPLKTSEVFRLFDFSKFVANKFGLEHDGQERPLAHIDRKLSKKEKIVLYGLVKYPTLRLNALADKLKISRQTLSKIKDRLLDEDIVRTINIPACTKLGCELLCFFHARFDPVVSDDNKEKAARFARKRSNAHLILSSDLESCVFNLFNNYSEFTSMRDDIQEKYDQAAIAVEKLNIIMVPMHDLRFKKLEFAPLVAQAFEADLPEEII